jgi:hypothetical protein
VRGEGRARPLRLALAHADAALVGLKIRKAHIEAALAWLRWRLAAR